jgi:Sec-independent protein translocase protein TatA
LGAGLGKGIREFTKAMSDGAKEAAEGKESPKEIPK